ncbi:integral membrane protein [Rutstroemia sp. NJR-2017a BBW]|nr:integral membrane protein [Rutstroemia sp. NJR-2017a BBW]
MGGIKNIVEPLGIVLIFTITTLANRSRDRDQATYKYQEARRESATSQSSLISHHDSSPSPQPSLKTWLPHPDTSPFHRTLLSRFLRKFPFLIEIWYWALTYWPYQLLRARTAVWINSDPARKAAVAELAEQNALRILRVEKWLRVDVEYALQRFVMQRCRPWVMTLLCDVYLAHITRLRRTIAINNFIAFAVLTAYRCTPPRLMPDSFGFVDVLHPRPGTGIGAPSDWANNRFQLTLAAMPSLHFGTSMVIGASMTIWGRHKILRMLGPVYPMLMGLVVLATANHWVLDCVVGLAVVSLGWRVNRLLLVLKPFEEWGFWLFRAEKPRAGMVTKRRDVED